MLIYKFNALKDSQQELVEMECEDIYMSSDGSYISGVTSAGYNLLNGQTIYIGYDPNNLMAVEVETQNVVRQGYIVYNQEYVLETHTVINGSSHTDYEVVRYKDGKYYPEVSGKITIEGNTYIVSSKTDNSTYRYISVPTKYYAEDGYITINGYKYEVEIDLRSASTYTPIVYLTFNQALIVQEYDRSKWKNVTLFKINKKSDLSLTLDNICCASRNEYIIYGAKTIYKDRLNCCDEEKFDVTTDNYASITDEKYYLKYEYDDPSKVGTSHTGEYKKYVEIGNTKITASLNTYSITISGTVVPIEEEWVNSVYDDNYLNLYVNREDIQFYQGQHIKVTSLNGDGEKCYRQTYPYEYYPYCGNRYLPNTTSERLEYIILNGIEYKVDMLSATTANYIGYFTLDDSPIAVSGTFGSNIVTSYTTTGSSKTTYSVNSYNFVTIDGEKFPIYTEERKTNSGVTLTDYYVDVTGKTPTYDLVIVNVEGKSALRCKVNGSDPQGIPYMLSVNKDNYQFELVHALFAQEDIEAETAIFVDEYYRNDEIHFYNPSGYLSFNISLPNSMADNLRQEEIVNNDFYEVEKEKAINPIVDMEKDVYEPVYFVDGTPHMYKSIKFNLHFRTRNLDDWKVVEDYTVDAGTSITSSTVTACNWNFVDYYLYDTNNLGKDFKTNLKPYYPPSDLLYYLNFDDDDVFYQKQKISRSFIRLMFYDSTDPKVQSLLATSTIYLDEHNLYNTYINNSNQGEIKKLYYQNMENKSSFVNYISVESEPVDSTDSKTTYAEDGRLDSTIEVKNKYESDASSEGFYLYMFKEYSTALHERTIYMKVQFNHAGEGKVCNMFVPQYNGDLVNFKEEAQVKSLIKGVPLKDLYNSMYVPITVKYNEELKKYVYYFNDIFTKHLDSSKDEMIFNLFEVKIKDES